jgi:two-component system, OmpR family, response regulator
VQVIDFQSFAGEPVAPIKIMVAEPASERRLDLVRAMDRPGITAEGVDREDALFRNLTGSAQPDALVLNPEVAAGAMLDLLRRIRSRSDVPVILTRCDKTDEIDRVLALELGADDLVDARVGPHELLARVRAILRRAACVKRGVKARLHIYRFGEWCFDQKRRRLIDGAGHAHALSKSEFALLTAFVTAPHRILSREHLLGATREHDDIYDRSVDVQVLRLRRKLGDNPQDPRFIRTERGLGYVFEADVRIV